MRIIGFSQMWDKLKQPQFTTFRFPRKDKDWAVGEKVSVVYKPRRKGGGNKLGIAEIVGKEPRAMAWNGDKTGLPKVTNIEAQQDGFVDTYLEAMFGFPPSIKEAYFNMWEFLWDNYGGERLMNEAMNKLTLRWI